MLLLKEVEVCALVFQTSFQKMKQQWTHKLPFGMHKAPMADIAPSPVVAEHKLKASVKEIY